jgi:hypothetical protein
VRNFAAANAIPVLQLKKPDRTRWDDRKLDHVRRYLDEAEAEKRFGVVADGVRREVHPRIQGNDAPIRRRLSRSWRISAQLRHRPDELPGHGRA